MEEIEIALPAGTPPETLAALVEALAASQGLHIRLRGTLRSYPGSLHWHLARPGERGTLEVTCWPARNRLWLSVQSGRRAAWIEQTLPLLQTALERALKEENS